MLKFGIISEVDAQNGLARVNFIDDGFVSAPLKMAVSRSGTDKVSFPFNINEHVFCIMDENLEYGVIGGAVYDESNKPDKSAKQGVLSLKFGDNSMIYYDRNSHNLTLEIKGELKVKCTAGSLKAGAKVFIKAPEIQLEGMVNVTGNVTVNGTLAMAAISGIAGGAVEGGDTEISVKKLSASQDIQVAGLAIKGHKHVSAPPGSPTSPPIP